MDLEMVFNELSVLPHAPDVPTARERMATAVDAIAGAIRLGVRPVLRTNEEFQNTLLAPNYLLAQWRNDPTVNRDLRVLFSRVEARTPFLEDISNAEIVDRVERSEFRYKGKIAIGLSVALVIDGLAISLMSSEEWGESTVLLDVDTIDSDGEILSEKSEVIHASNLSHVEGHQVWIQKRRRTGVRGGTDLWNRRGELFPRLSLCENVGSQLVGLGANHPMLGQIKKRLFELNDYAAQWEEGMFNASALPNKVTPESLSTMREYRNQRSFLCPDGVVREFSWHARLTPEAWRLHFFPDTDRRIIIIGYIGPKLPTVTDPT